MRLPWQRAEEVSAGPVLVPQLSPLRQLLLTSIEALAAEASPTLMPYVRAYARRFLSNATDAECLGHIRGLRDQLDGVLRDYEVIAGFQDRGGGSGDTRRGDGLWQDDSSQGAS